MEMHKGPKQSDLLIKEVKQIFLRKGACWCESYTKPNTEMFLINLEQITGNKTDAFI